MIHKDWYGKQEATLVSGVAILLMLAHHFFGFKDYLADNVGWISLGSLAGYEIERIIAAFGKICVSIFAFNSGYVIWCQRSRYQTWYQRVHRSILFLISYWIICALFWLYAIVVGDSIPDWPDMLWNLIGMRTGQIYDYVNVAFAWYVTYYIVFVLISPILLWALSSTKWWIDVIVTCVISWMLSVALRSYDALGFMWPLDIGVLAMLAAKYKVFKHIDIYVKGHLHTWLACLIIGSLIILRQGLLLVENQFVLWGGVIETLFVITLIYCVVTIFSRVKYSWITTSMALFGVYSMNMWFLHGIFFTGSRPLQTWLYMPKYSITVYIWGILLIFPVAWILSKFQEQLKHKLR